MKHPRFEWVLNQPGSPRKQWAQGIHSIPDNGAAHRLRQHPGAAQVLDPKHIRSSAQLDYDFFCFY
jgi:hypothetical protein